MTRIYTTASAVVTGSEHVRARIGCHDAAALRHLENGELLVAVSDGAGSAQHPDVGARLAVESALSYLASIASGDAPDAPTLIAHVQAALRAEAARLEVPLAALSCTLLAARIGPEHAFFAQLGDGAIVVRVAADAPLTLVFPPHKGEHANETRFVTASDAVAHVQATTAPAPSALAMLTDGLERQALDLATHTPFAPFFAPFFAALAELAPLDPLAPLAPGSLEAAESELSAELAAFLASPRVAEATGDDVTLVLALR